jgi:hypothetical protein
MSFSAVPSFIYCQRILEEVLKYKLVFIETPDAIETSIALENYRMVRMNGRQGQQAKF